MSKKPTYEFIGRLATAANTIDTKIPFSALRKILRHKGDEYKEYNSERAMARGVEAAHSYWSDKGEEGDPVVPAAIAHTYVDRNGEFAWDN